MCIQTLSLRPAKWSVVLCLTNVVFLIFITCYSGQFGESNYIRQQKDSLPLCRRADEYTDGEWIRNDAITAYPYLSADDYEWGPQCMEIQNRYLATGIVPDFLRYQWKPHSCELVPFSKDDFCRRMNGQTIGTIGDSIMQQFAHSFMGRFLGKVDASEFVYGEAEWFSKLRVPLCNDTPYTVTLLFHRWNKYQAQDADREALAEIAQASDYLIFNWGVHYLPWNDMEDATKDFIRLLEEQWRFKKSERLFWRSTIVAHDGCKDATAPEKRTKDGHFDTNKNPAYNTNEILLQDEHIVRPLLSESLLNVTFLRVERSTMMRKDGHRVIGHKGTEDCLHYCEPGPIDSWVDLFYHLVVALEI